MRTSVVIGTVMVVLAVLGVYGYLAIHRADTQGFMIVLAWIAPVVGLLWNNKQIENVKDSVNTIEHNTNGTLKELKDELPGKVAEHVIEAQDNAKE